MAKGATHKFKRRHWHPEGVERGPHYHPVLAELSPSEIQNRSLEAALPLAFDLLFVL